MEAVPLAFAAYRTAKDILPIAKKVLEAASQLSDHMKGQDADELVEKVKEVQTILAFLNDISPQQPSNLVQKLNNAQKALGGSKDPSLWQKLLGRRPDFRAEIEEMNEEIEQLKDVLRTQRGYDLHVDDERDLMTVEGLLKLAHKTSGDEAYGYFRAAAEKEHDNLEVWYQWGKMLSAAGKASDLKEAISKFKCALECNPNHPETLHQWGLVLMKSKGEVSLEQARSKLWEAREKLFFTNANKNKLASSILTDLAFVLAELDHNLAAAYCLKEAVLYNTRNAKAFWKLGQVLAEEDEYEESLSSFESAFQLAQLDPQGCPEGLAAWGKALFRCSQDESDVQKRAQLQEEAQRKCEEALKACDHEDPSSRSTALHFLGEVLKEKKLFKEAIQKFQEANDATEDHWTICQWALALSELKRYKEAVKMLEDQYKKMQQDDLEFKADVRKTWATVLKKQGKLEAANEAFRDAGDLYKSAGKSAEADECSNLASPASSSSGAPAGSSPAKKPKLALHYEPTYSSRGFNPVLWDAFQSSQQPIELSSAQALWSQAMADGKLDPSERQVFEYILSAETPVQVEPQASDFLEEKLKRKRTRRARSRTPRRRS